MEDAFLLFSFRLAKELGLPRAEMLSRMSSMELTGWMAFFQFEHDEWKKHNP